MNCEANAQKPIDILRVSLERGVCQGKTSDLRGFQELI
jgi:hypothetical protein